MVLPVKTSLALLEQLRERDRKILLTHTNQRDLWRRKRIYEYMILLNDLWVNRVNDEYIRFW